ncbi:MAG: peptidyl-prolyl cis-trans isomerase [Rhodomicrobium sp.]
MMHMLRKAAVAVMFAILIGAFAISMGGNYSFDRFRHPNVAKVGSIEVTPQQFQRAYERAVENLSARAGRRITASQAKALGMPARVLQELIQESAIDLEAKKLGLGLSETGLRQSITGNEIFQDTAGKFSPEKYQQFLQRIGYNAPGFEYEYRNDLIRRQIQSLFSASGVVPATLLDAFNRYTNEQRTIAYFTLDANAAGTIEAPSDDALRSFYEERKRQFMAPELRKVALLAIAPQTIAGRIAVSDEEIKAEYDARAADYAVPERRKIEAITFQTKEAAESAAAVLKAKNDFAGVAKRAGFSESDISLGTVSKKELSEKFATNDAILNAAFGLKKGETSQPIDGPLSWVILRVPDIIPGKEKSFDEVKDQIRADLVKARSAAESAKLIKAFEDERASGVQLQESAKKLGLPLEEVTIDHNGNGPDGKPVQVEAVPAQTLVSAAFKSDVGVENEALRLQGGGYAWFDVQDLVKARQKSFDEVKAEAEADWRKDQVRARLAEKARDLVARLNRSEAIADVAKSVGAEVKTTEPLKRDASEPALPPSAIAQAFSLAEGGASSAVSGDGASRAVFQVAKTIAPGPLDEAGAKALEQRLSGQIAEDNFHEYLVGIEKAAGVSVDNKNFAAVAGGNYEGED